MRARAPKGAGRRTGDGPELGAKKRLDVELVARGLAPSRAEAAALVSAGRVLVAGAVADKTSRQVAPSEPLVVKELAPRFASRGGEKLDAAIHHFKLDVVGRHALDAGASTGGFTDCLLAHGAAHVVAVDVGHGQLLERLRRDPRVEVVERANVRYLGPADLGGRRFDVVVADLSFISLMMVAPALLALAQPDADLVVLVKPQFEAGRAVVSKGKGVVRDPKVWASVLCDVAGAFEAGGAAVVGGLASPLLGAEGNVEFFLHLRSGVRSRARLAPEAAELGPGRAEPEPGWAEPEPGRAQPEPGWVEPEPGRAPPEQGWAEPEPGRAQPEQGWAEPEPGRAEPEPGRAEPEPGRAEPEPGRAGPEQAGSELARSMDQLARSVVPRRGPGHGRGAAG